MNRKIWLARVCLIAAAAILAALPGASAAQSVTIDMGGGNSLAQASIQILLIVTLLGLVPGLAIMITCFPFIVTVLSILRQAIGLQQAPPNMLIVSLALFLTYFVMQPVFMDAWDHGAEPYMNGEIESAAAVEKMFEPFRKFMASRTNPKTFASLAQLRSHNAGTASLDAQAPPSLLIPAFLLSEITRAFQIGFLIFLPFLIIDLVVAAVLMSMGMMMVPPAVVSLPFKLAFFVMADGWTLVSDALVRGYF